MNVLYGSFIESAFRLTIRFSTLSIDYCIKAWFHWFKYHIEGGRCLHVSLLVSFMFQMVPRFSTICMICMRSL